MAIEIQIEGARRELEPLTNEQLILCALASLVSYQLPSEIYYQVMANILRERSRGDLLSQVLELLFKLNDEQLEKIREECFK